MGKPSNGYRLMIRNCFTDLLALTIKGCAFIGTSGVGKSWFGFYVLWNFAANSDIKKIVYENKHLTNFIADRQANGSLSVAVTSRWGAERARHTNGAVYICDGCEPAEFDPKTVTAIFVASESVPGREFWKVVGRRCYHPPLSFDECHTMRAACYPSIELRRIDEYYDLLGGIPRWMFHPESSAGQLELRGKLGSLSTVGALVAVVGATGSDAKESVKTRDVLVHIIPTSDFLECYKVYASEYVERELVRMLETEALSELVSMYFKLPPELRGPLFESICHKFVPENREFSSRSLPCDHDSEIATVAFQRRRVELFDDVGSVRWEDGVYYHPNVSNFAGGDAFEAVMEEGTGSRVKMLRVFEMTVAKAESRGATAHPINSKLDAVVSSFQATHGAPDLIDYVFVVPGERFPEWYAIQAFVGSSKQLLQRIPTRLCGLRQRVMRVDVSVR